MDIVAEFTRLSRAPPKVLCSPALLPFAVGAATVAAESSLHSSSEMVSGEAKQRQDCWLAFDFGTMHQVNVSEVRAQHSSRTAGHMLQVHIVSSRRRHVTPEPLLIVDAD